MTTDEIFNAMQQLEFESNYITVGDNITIFRTLHLVFMDYLCSCLKYKVVDKENNFKAMIYLYEEKAEIQVI